MGEGWGEGEKGLSFSKLLPLPLPPLVSPNKWGSL